MGQPEGEARRGKPGGGSPEEEARRGKPGGGSPEGEARRSEGEAWVVTFLRPVGVAVHLKYDQDYGKWFYKRLNIALKFLCEHLKGLQFVSLNA